MASLVSLCAVAFTVFLSCTIAFSSNPCIPTGSGCVFVFCKVRCVGYMSEVNGDAGNLALLKSLALAS